MTLLFEAGGLPLSDVTTLGSQSGDTVIAPRSPAARAFALTRGMDVTGLFSRDGRMYRWSLRLEEALPSSYHLVSLREPGESDRRAFVRADVPVQLRLRERESGPWQQVFARLDLSAAGFRVEGIALGQDISRVDVEFQASGTATPVLAHAVVVRRVARGNGMADVAFRFHDMSSTDEGRVVEIVFAAREAALRSRLGI